MISRYPLPTESPVAAKIGQSGSAIASTQASFFSLKSITATDFEQNPAVRIGSFRMSMNASDDWTVNPLTNTDGIGLYQERNRFAMSVGQFGAKAGTVFIDNGGTAPTMNATAAFGYEIIDDQVFMDSAIAINAGGAGAVNLVAKVPYISGIGGLCHGTMMFTDAAASTIFWMGNVAVASNNDIIFNASDNTTTRRMLNTDIGATNGVFLRLVYPISFI